MLARRDGFEVSDDRARLDRDAIHRYLATQSYWAQEIPRATLDRAIDHSLCFGLYRGTGLVGFARVITDHATFAYLCDVFVLPEAQGRGLGTWLIECVVAHPDLQGLRRFCLMTTDAHTLYRRFGFTEIGDPRRYLEVFSPAPALYRRKEASA